jgi:hypothetical protein
MTTRQQNNNLTDNVNSQKRSPGRPKNDVLTTQCAFYLSTGLKKAIDDHGGGNNSRFVDKVFREWFDSHGVEIVDQKK